MNGRDHEYIENRLIAPAMELSAAHERLRKAGEYALADEAMTALQEVTDRCREIRRKLNEKQYGR